MTVYVEGVFESYHEVSGVAVNAAHTMSHVLDGIGRVVSIRTGTARAGDKSPAVRHELADHLGSVALAVDGAGKAYQKEEFTPYGETSFGSSIGKRHRFTGKERDDESGLSYHSARYYMPWAGRWASSDPLGPSDGVNPYAYTWGRPLVFIDPSGMYNKPSNMCLERPPPEPSRLVTLGLPDPSVEMQPTISAAPSRQIITSLPDRETPQEKFQRDLEFGAYLTQNPAAAMRYSLGKTVYGEGEEQSRVAATRTGEIAELLSTPGVKLVRPALFKSKTPVPVPRTGPKGVDPDHHNANVIVRDINGAVVTHTRLVSGNMTAAEKALGFPKGPLASHTEARGTRQIPLEPGQTMTITGIQEPCTSCRGYMNRAAKQFGVVIRYQWREGGKTMQWFAAPGPPPRR